MSAQAKRPWKGLAKPQIRSLFMESRTYYSADDIAAILATFQPRPDLDRAHFARRIEFAAFWLVNSAFDERNNTADAPSERVRYWRRLGEQISAIMDKLRGLDRNHEKDLIRAGRDLAIWDTGLPDFEGEPAHLPAEGNALEDVRIIWPAEQQIDKALDELQWLARCVQRAAQRAEEDKTGSGRQPDEPLHEFVREAVALLQDASIEPVKKPWTDPGTNERHGIMLDFLDAALRPLRPYDLRARERRFQELYGIISRALSD